MACDCMKTVNDKLKDRHVELSVIFSVANGKFDAFPSISLEPATGYVRKRGEKLPSAMAPAFCPFCGLRYEAEAAPSGNPAEDPLADLVTRFSAELLEKLRAAEAKHGFNDRWLKDDWRDELVTDLARHVDKGDPRDVAAYCAFAWHHQWSIAPAADAPITESIHG